MNFKPSPAFGRFLLVVAGCVALSGCGDAGDAKEYKVQSLVAELGGKIETNADGQATFVNLSDTNADNETLASIASLSQLEKLWLAETNITDAGMPELSKLSNLRVLVLSETYVSNVGLKHLAALDNLRELYLHGSRVNKNGVEQLQAELPNVSIIY